MSTLTIYRIDVSAQSVVCKVCHNCFTDSGEGGNRNQARPWSSMEHLLFE
jgi:hypothetical protein